MRSEPSIEFRHSRRMLISPTPDCPAHPRLGRFDLAKRVNRGLSYIYNATEGNEAIQRSEIGRIEAGILIPIRFEGTFPEER